MIRPAEVATGQMLWFYDQQAVLRQGIIGDCDGPAAKFVADDMLEFGAALGSWGSNASWHVLSDIACLTRGDDKYYARYRKCFDKPHLYLRRILFCCQTFLGTRPSIADRSVPAIVLS